MKRKKPDIGRRGPEQTDRGAGARCRRKEGKIVKRIIYDGEEITPEIAMKWFCWHELVTAMEKHQSTIKKVTKIMNAPEYRNTPEWEHTFLNVFLNNATEDLIVY